MVHATDQYKTDAVVSATGQFRARELRHLKGRPAPTSDMVTAGEALGLAVLVFANTAIAALLTRFFRVRLETQWGSLLYIAFGVPVVLLITTLVLGTVLGPDLGTPAAVVGVTIVLPFSLGLAFDYFWMPAPDEVDLPDRADGQNVRRNP